MIDHNQNIIDAKRELSKDWKDETDKLLAAFQNGSDWLDIVKERLKSMYGDINATYIQKHIQLVDIVRFTVDQLSTVHETSADHILMDADGEPVKTDDPKWETYQRLLKDTRYDDITKQSEEWNNLLNTCTINILPDFKSKQLKLQLVEAPELVVVQDPIFHDVLDKCSQIAVRSASNTDSVESRPKSEIEYIMYTRTEVGFDQPDVITAWLTDENFDALPEDKQPEDMGEYEQYITAYPIVHIQSRAAKRGDLFRKIPQDLLTLADFVTWRMTSRQYVIWVKQQEPYTTSTPDSVFTDSNAPNPSSTPMTIIFGVENMQSLDWAPKTQDYLEDMRGALQTFAQARGLPQSFASDTVAPESGVAKYWNDKPRIERRKKAAVYYGDVEDNNLFPKLVEMAIMVDYPGAEALKGCTQKTSFPDPTSEVSPMEQRELDAADVALGLHNKVTLYMRDNDLTQEEAIERMAALGLQVATAPITGGLTFGRRQTTGTGNNTPS